MTLASLPPTAASFLSFHLVLTITAWGLWGIFDKLALERSQPKDVFLATTLLAIPQIPLLVILLYWTQPEWHLTFALTTYAAISSVVSSLGMMLYLNLMKRTDTTVVLSLTAAYPLVTQVVCLFVMDEVFSAGRAVGALFIALGVVVIGLTDNSSPQPLTNLPPSDPCQPQSNRKLGVLMPVSGVFLTAIVINVCWGLKGVFEKLAVKHGTPLEAYYAECLTNLVVLAPVMLWFVWKGHKPQLRSARLWRYTGLSEVSLAIGGWSYLTALSLAPASYVVTVTSTYPLLMYFVAIFVLNEKFNRIRLAGIACIVCGGLMV